jgi:hypothetical protein
MRRSLGFLLLAGSLTLSPVRAQTPDSKAPPRPIKLSLNALVELQPAEGQLESVVLVGQPRYTGGPMVDANGKTMQVRTETRTRIVMVNGKQETQTYTVSIPYTTNNPSSAKKPSPTTSRRVVRLDELQAWNLRGELVPQSDLPELMTRPLAAFVLTRPWAQDAAIDPVQSMVLRDDALLIYVPPKRP